MITTKNLAEMSAWVERTLELKKRLQEKKDFDTWGELEYELSNLNFEYAERENFWAEKSSIFEGERDKKFNEFRHTQKSDAATERLIAQDMQEDIIALELEKHIIKKLGKQIGSFDRVCKYFDRFFFRDNTREREIR